MGNSMGTKKETWDSLRIIYVAYQIFNWLFKYRLYLCLIGWILHYSRYMQSIVYNIYFDPCLYSVLPLTLWLAN